MSCKVEMRGISFRNGDHAVLDSVNLTVEPGHVAIFGGRSGHGKSSLLEVCAGLRKPAEGAVFWDGDDIAMMSKYELYSRRKAVGYVFQVHALISNHSVFDNIALPLKCLGELTGREIGEKVRAQMHELGIDAEHEKKFPEMLSAAQLRSVAIARALINAPRLLLLDEPFSGVDPFTADRIISVLHSRWKKDGMSIIMATHAMSAWPEWSTGRYLLKEGRLSLAGESFAVVNELKLKYNQRYSYAK